jgi:flagellin
MEVFSMRINHNIPSMITQASMFRVGRDLNKSLERLSTGLRINRASDDAAGLGVSENLRTQVNGTAQAAKNAQDGISALNIAEGAANEISAILQRMRELAVQSANDTLTSVERAYTNQEFTALRSEINRISEVTNFNGMALLSNVSGSERFGDDDVLWVDANDRVGADSITISINTISSTSIGVGTSTVDNGANAQSAITALDSAINSVNSMRSDLGAYINRLEHSINNLHISNSNQQAAESQIRDVDFAHETAQYTRNQILIQSGTAMLAQANMVPQTVLQLLG